MSTRGPRGGRARGLGSGAGHGKGKTELWEWESYRPGAEVYDELWHLRREPVTVRPFLSTECPIENAQSRILDRGQSMGEIKRVLYTVEITRFEGRDPSNSDQEAERPTTTETLHVDLSRILEYVSAGELERYENEQFRLEAEAEKTAKRAEAQELAQRRLERNARDPGAGKGSRLLNGLGLHGQLRMRGRPRGRGRARGRGSWPGRGTLTMTGELGGGGDDMRETMVHVEPTNALNRKEEDIQLMIAETDYEEDLETGVPEQTSPGLARSAFVANSALPLSRIAPLRRPAGILIMHRRRPPYLSSLSHEDIDFELIDADARSMSSAAMQLRIEEDFHDRSDNASEGEGHGYAYGRSGSKRPRMESMSSGRSPSPARKMPPKPRLSPQFPVQASSIFGYFPNESALPENDTYSDSDDGVPAQSPDSVHQSLQSPSAESPSLSHAKALAPSVPEVSSDAESDSSGDCIPAQSPDAVYQILRPSNATRTGSNRVSEEQSIEGSAEDETAEEYVVEAIMEHYREDGKNYYLVKWEGYENSYDRFPEEDLDGATKLVADYKDMVKRRKGRMKAK